VLTDADGVPLAATITAANIADATEALKVVASVPPVAGKPGRPKTRPSELVADKAYDSKDLRSILNWLGIRPDIPHRGDDRRGLGVVRWPVERTIAWLHQFRRLAIRWERREDYHQAFLDLACSIICHRILT
jgi:transposase